MASAARSSPSESAAEVGAAVEHALGELPQYSAVRVHSRLHEHVAVGVGLGVEHDVRALATPLAVDGLGLCETRSWSLSRGVFSFVFFFLFFGRPRADHKWTPKKGIVLVRI